jgi:hypothetical protein
MRGLRDDCAESNQVRGLMRAPPFNFSAFPVVFNTIEKTNYNYHVFHDALLIEIYDFAKSRFEGFVF